MTWKWITTGAGGIFSGRSRGVARKFARDTYSAPVLFTPGRLRALVSAALVVLSWFTAAPASAVPVPSAQIDYGGTMRTYRLHLPAGGPPSGLVVNLHAAGATGADQAALTHYDAVADAYGFAVVYPDGIDYSWADGRGASVPDRQGVDDVGFIATLVDRLVAENGIPRGRVYATGLSAGGFMANRLACDRADLFAAIAPVAGTLGTNVGCNPSRPVSVLATYGTADPVVPFDGGPMTGRGGGSTVVSGPAMVDRWRQINGCPAPSDEALPSTGDGTETHRIASDGCAAGTSVVFMRVDGGGHTWPGVPEILPVQSVGAASRAFDASDASAQFFASHGR
ncbi:polyhydroxybutyrate depolymerase [Mycobacterium sp. 88mf]|nr:prolyl oligopeptidase family serine peptidase [Mycolicibacterium septicum]QRY44298.1 prolyl oligopeptidase family serine peptidase [Mycolicibacterium boenickei]SER91767.1 polyhydroxybutyrate depolymerase [Mycobacterium sp. 88mf]SFF50865.1 polyhydroxybutyrate depolymerase [Mycobacterium sp. 455mf]